MRALRHAAAAIFLVAAVVGMLGYLMYRFITAVVTDVVWFMLVAGPLAAAEMFLGRDLTEYRNKMRKYHNE